MAAKDEIFDLLNEEPLGLSPDRKQVNWVQLYSLRKLRAVAMIKLPVLPPPDFSGRKHTLSPPATSMDGSMSLYIRLIVLATYITSMASYIYVYVGKFACT